MTELYYQFIGTEMPLLRQNRNMVQLQKCIDLLEKCHNEISYEFYRGLYGELEYIKEQIERKENNG